MAEQREGVAPSSLLLFDGRPGADRAAASPADRRSKRSRCPFSSSPALEVGPPLKPSTRGPEYSHQETGRSAGWGRRGCASTGVPGASLAASAGVVISLGNWGCR